jgi:Recombination endonuclease VII
MAYRDANKRRAYHRKYRKTWDAKNLDKLRRYAQKWRHSEKGKMILAARRATEKSKKYHRDWMKRTYHADPIIRAERLAKTKEWLEKNRMVDKLRKRRRKLQLRYGLTLEQYAQMLQNQKGLCAICQNPPKPNKNLAVDHDHRTGQVRELLCSSCNMILGKIENKIGMIPLFIYITRHSAKPRLKIA